MNNTEPMSQELPPVRNITFAEAFRLFFTQYATYAGRATRTEYWCIFLFNLLVYGSCALLKNLAPSLGAWLNLLYGCAVFVPSTALFTRRMHDIGKCGWAFLWVLVPIVGAFVLLVFVCRDSQGDNQYGPRKI